ncbi:MAG: hypothetical protein H7336_10700 [Bacteriovorax sp.]|nr:hypothetical protein [Bacteriovorax sp.]
MKVNLDKISKRAKGFYESPQFLNSNLLEDFVVTLDSSDKILTVFYKDNPGEVELIFSEALAIFSQNRTQNDLWKINFREFENFLRDENHLPAFNESVQDLDDVLTKIKISLIASMLRKRFKADLNSYIDAIYHWRNLTMTARNIWANDFLAAIGWELIFCDEATLTVSRTPAGAANESLEYLLQKILGCIESGLPMKVVAVQ